MRDRVRPTKEHDELLNQLKNDELFATRQKAMMFAAALGFVADKADTIEPFEGVGEGIPLSIFERASDDGFIDSIAVAQDNDLHVLSAEKGDRRLEIFEFYARRGLERMQRSCYRAGQDPLQGVLDLIEEFGLKARAESSTPQLESSLKELSKLM